MALQYQIPPLKGDSLVTYISVTWLIALALMILIQTLVTLSSETEHWDFWWRLAHKFWSRLEASLRHPPFSHWQKHPHFEKVIGMFCVLISAGLSPLSFFFHPFLFLSSPFLSRSKCCVLVIKANFHHSFSPPVTSAPSLAKEWILMGGGWLVQSRVVWMAVEN